MNKQKARRTPTRRESSAATAESLCISQHLSTSPSRVPKIRKVNEYLIYYDEVLGKGQFGTVVKAQLATESSDAQDS